MTDVYAEIPVLENDKFMLREIREADGEDLLKVYSDEKAVPIFNSDNCNGDNFYYKTMQQIQKAIKIAKARIEALEKKGFHLSDELLVGEDGTSYDSYYVKEV